MGIIAPASTRPTCSLSFHGKGGTLFGMMIVNFFLSIITLGIYSFWGKAKVRRFLYSQTEIAGDRFAYHGMGKELFIGALKAFAILVVLGMAAIPLELAIGDLALIPVYLVILLMMPFALYGAWRYRLSRSSWRGIRFSFRGSLKECYASYLGGFLLTALTFGIYYPWFRANMHRYWLGNAYLGNTRFEYDGRGSALIGNYILSLILTIPTLSLVWFWYKAKEHRYDWSQTRFAQGKFESTVTGGELLGMALLSAILTIVTLGLAYPWVVILNLNYLFDHLALHGDLALDQILQEKQVPGVTGTAEGLAEALDIGSALG